MASASALAWEALLAALAPAFQALGHDGFARNVSALSDMRPLAGGGDMFATQRDGAVEIDAVQMGAPRAYELIVRADVELVVVDADDARRDQSFDAGLIAIDDALEADRLLGGAVSDVEVERIDPLDLAIEGAEGTKAAIVVIRMLVTSDRPF